MLHSTPFLSIVIPCFNEADVLPSLEKRLRDSLKELGRDWEVVFVDDGSRDSTWGQLERISQTDARFKAIAFSRNFGHQPAVSAGLAFATGEVVGVMDADLQDPPELLGECLEKIRQGYDVVYAVRRKRKEHLVKRVAYRLFYRLLRSASEVDMPLDAGDFCVMRRNVVNVLVNMRERNIFVRGMRAWTGFKQFGLEYERSARAAGQTKYPLMKLVRLASDGIFSFSILPLRLASGLGFGTLLITLAVATFLLMWRILGFRFMGHTPHELPGWTALAIGVLFFGGIQLLILGFIGEYIGRIYSEVKQRPRWVIRETAGISLESIIASDPRNSNLCSSEVQNHLRDRSFRGPEGLSGRILL